MLHNWEKIRTTKSCVKSRIQKKTQPTCSSWKSARLLVTEKGSCWVWDAMKGEWEVEYVCWGKRSGLFTALIPTETCSRVLSEIRSGFQNILKLLNYYMPVKKLLERTAPFMDCFLFLHLLVTFNKPYLFRLECVYFTIPPCSKSKNNYKLNEVALDRQGVLKLLQYSENRKRT